MGWLIHIMLTYKHNCEEGILLSSYQLDYNLRNIFLSCISFGVMKHVIILCIIILKLVNIPCSLIELQHLIIIYICSIVINNVFNVNNLWNIGSIIIDIVLGITNITIAHVYTI